MSKEAVADMLYGFRDDVYEVLTDNLDRAVAQATRKMEKKADELRN